jgi:hypothetical protein
MEQKLSVSSIQSEAERAEHARTGTRLANEMAAAGAALLAHMSTGGALAAIPETDPQQYVVAGTLAMIGQVLGQSPAPIPEQVASIEGLTRWTFDGGMTASVSKDGQWYAVKDVERLLATQSAKQGAHIPQVVREAIEAAFEDRDDWRTKIAAAVRTIGQASVEQATGAKEEILSLHRQLAAEKLRADQGWQRAEAKSKECIELRERMAEKGSK